MDKAIDFLMRRLIAVGDLSEEDRERLLSLPFRRKRVSKGEEIVSEGNKSSSCCLVISGYLHRSKALVTGNRQIFSLHMAGDIPDLHSLHLPRMDHSLVATAPAEVAMISHAAIQRVLDQSSRLTALFWRDTLIDAAAFRAWMLMLGQAEAPVRMAHLFCELYVRSQLVGLNKENSFALPISQIDLADMLGTSTVHANRTLQDLRLQGLV
ncbi:MAG: Crp/Fnr family transcriptional regulator, partial [Hyphomicrobiales bacterium]